MKRFCVFALTCIVVLCCTGCSMCDGYNDIMRKHLSNKDNYYFCSFIVSDVRVSDDNGFISIVDKIGTDYNFNYDRYYFYGKLKILDDTSQKEYQLRVKVIGENVNILVESGLLNNSSFLTKTFYIHTSMWTYMDGDSNILASLSDESTSYLDFETGLQNNIEYFNNNKSVF